MDCHGQVLSSIPFLVRFICSTVYDGGNTIIDVGTCISLTGNARVCLSVAESITIERVYVSVTGKSGGMKIERGTA